MGNSKKAGCKEIKPCNDLFELGVFQFHCTAKKGHSGVHSVSYRHKEERDVTVCWTDKEKSKGG